MGFPVGRDNDGLIHSLVDSGLEEEWHIVDHDGVGVVHGGGSHQTHLFPGDSGVDDPFQPPPLSLVAKYDGTNRPAIEAAIGVENGRAELLHDLPPRRFAWPDNLSCQIIGIDDDGATLSKHSCDCTFPGCHTTGQTDKHHGSGAYHAVCRTIKGD